MESVPRLTDPVVRGNSWDQRLAHKVNKFHVARADLPRKKLISSVVSTTRTLHTANRVARTRGERSMRESFARSRRQSAHGLGCRFLSPTATARSTRTVPLRHAIQYGSTQHHCFPRRAVWKSVCIPRYVRERWCSAGHFRIAPLPEP